MTQTREYRPSVYVETSIVSYRSSRPSRDLVVAGHQELTRQWWDEQRHLYRLVISPLVAQEAGEGDAEAASRRIALLDDAEMLDFDPASEALGQRLLTGLHMPRKARIDAFHLAVTITNRIDYLLTWNCAHLANADVIRRLAEFCRSENLWLPIICTPMELLGRTEQE